MDKAYYREMWEEAREELKLVDEENKDLRAENTRLKAEAESMKKPAVVGGYNISEYIRMANSETLNFDNGDIFADMTLPERIKYIVESHARLKAEVERLNEIIRREVDGGVGLREEAQRTVEENHKLRAEVERLTKAHSDALADFWAIHKGYFDLKAEVEQLQNRCDFLEGRGKE